MSMRRRWIVRRFGAGFERWIKTFDSHEDAVEYVEKDYAKMDSSDQTPLEWYQDKSRAVTRTKDTIVDIYEDRWSVKQEDA